MSLLLLLFAAVVISCIVINYFDMFKVISCFILKGPSSFAFCLASLFLALFLSLTWIASIGFYFVPVNPFCFLSCFMLFLLICAFKLHLLDGYVLVLEFCLQWQAAFFQIFIFFLTTN